MKIITLLFIMCLCGVSAYANDAQQEADVSLPLHVRLVFHDGRDAIVEYVGMEDGALVVRRTMRSGFVATERYAPEDVRAALFPRPSYLSVTQDFSSAEAITRERAAAQAAYDFWHSFAAFPGSRWHIPLTHRLAYAYEKDGAYADALALYRRLYDETQDETTKTELRLRKAACIYHLNQAHDAEPLFTAVRTATDATDAHRAEAWYYTGILAVEDGAYTNAVFAFLRPTIFYRMHEEWAPKSLLRILPLYAQMARREEYIRVCEDILHGYPDTAYAVFAAHALERATNMVDMTELVTHSFFSKE